MIHLDCRATIGQVSQRRPREHLARQGGPHALARPPPAQPRRHHEPGRSPDGRWRRPHLGGRHPCSPWGQLAKGLKTRNNKRTDKYDRQAPQREVAEEDTAWRVQIKKGPFVDGHLHGEDRRRAGDATTKKVIKTWSRRSHDHPRGRRPHVRGAQRPQVRAGVRHREHGRAQARRVRADAHVPRPRGRQEEGAGASAAPRSPRRSPACKR